MLTQNNKKEIRFYHHTKHHVYDALIIMLGRCLMRGDKAIICCKDDDEVEIFDQKLWKEEFVPHGTYREKYATQQPILLVTTVAQNMNHAKIAFFNNLEIFKENTQQPILESEYIEIVGILFHENDEQEKNIARHLWREYKENQAYDISYWQQDSSGKWSNNTQL